MHALKLKIVLSFLKAIAHLPFPVLYAISDFFCFLMHRVAGYRRKVVRKNLRNSFPEKSAAELRSIEDAFYHHLCDCFVETIKLLHVSDDEMNERVKVHGGDLIDELAKDGRSFIFFLGHYGNWEWIQKVMWHYTAKRVNTVIYRPVKDKVFDEVMHVIRSRFNTEQIPQKRAVKTLLRYNSEGNPFVVAFISDQRPNSTHLHHWTTFLNQETPYAVGGEEIGRHVGAHFIYLDIEKPSRGHYDVTFREMAPAEGDHEYPYTISFLRMLEESIKRNPHCWLWSHNKWKFKKDAADVRTAGVAVQGKS